MPAVFCLCVFGSGSELIEVSVLVELGSCLRGLKLSDSIWTGSENNLFAMLKTTARDVASDWII